MSTCTKCGSEGRSDDRFCPTCGAQLNPSGNDDDHQMSAAEKAEMERAEHWFSIGKALMVLHKYEDAIIYFDKSLRESPEYKKSQQALDHCRLFLARGVETDHSATDVKDQNTIKVSQSAEKPGFPGEIGDTNELDNPARITNYPDPDMGEAEGEAKENEDCVKKFEEIDENEYLEDIELVEINPLDGDNEIGSDRQSTSGREAPPFSRNQNTDDTLEKIRKLRDLTREETEKDERKIMPAAPNKTRDEYFSLAHEAKKRGSLDAALELIDMGLSMYINDPGFLGLKGEILGRKKDYGESLKCFDIALEIDPIDAGLLTLKGIALFQLGNYSESLRCCERALDIDPDNEQARRGRLACEKRI